MLSRLQAILKRAEEILEWRITKMLLQAMLVVFVSGVFITFGLLLTIHGDPEFSGPSPQIEEVVLVYGLIGFGAVIMLLILFPILFSQLLPPAIVLLPAITIYLLLPAFFAGIFWQGGCIDGIDIISGTYHDYLYFTYLTWTSLGYAEFTPTGLCKPMSIAVAVYGHISLALITGAVLAVIIPSEKSSKK